MSSTIDADGRGNRHANTAGITPQDQERLSVMVGRLREERGTEVFEVFASVGAAAAAADTLDGMGFTVRRSVLLVEALS